jgi:hypothetical protein
MNCIYSKFVCVFTLLFAATLAPAQTGKATLHGRITDPSASSVPNALVSLRRAGTAELKRTTDLQGQYSFASIPAGKYTITVTRQGFSPAQMEDYDITGNVTLDFPLSVSVETEKVTVRDEIGKQVSVDPNQNAGALVLSGKDLDTLSDDPDQLEEDLQALAGPSAGPNGGQLYIDGFTGGRLPPKSSIREVRVNQNPFSAEFDRLGFGRIEIFTKPGTDKFRGQFMSMFSDNVFNARYPFVTERPPFQARIFSGSISGPINKRASFAFDVEHRGIDENAVINATVMDPATYAITNYTTSVQTPQGRWSIVPRVDIQLTPSNTLTARYNWSSIHNDNQGVGTYSLLSRAYDTNNAEHNLQLTETAVLSPTAINETRFQFRRDNVFEDGDTLIPSLVVENAFSGGGSQVGQARDVENHYEIQNMTSRNAGKHSWKFGGRVRTTTVDNTSAGNFGGTYKFRNIQQYAMTTQLLAQGLTGAQIRALGYGPYQFTISGGNPLASINQTDVGVYVTDDWRVRSNVTLSYGLRYENQNNLSDWKDVSPRFGLAWAIDGGKKRAAKTVLRAGAGVFYDRFSDSLTLSTLRYNGSNTLQYIINNPNFYPEIPSVDTLTASLQPSAIDIKSSNLRTPYVIQTAIGVERQLPHSSTIAMTYTFSRGVHMLRTRNINAPDGNGVYPYSSNGDAIYEYESTGTMRQHQLITNFNTRFNRRISLFGFYMLNQAKSDTDGVGSFPSDTYNLATEWGSSSFDVRHRVFTGGSITIPGRVMFSPFVTASSGQPFNITLGNDLNHDGILNERPAFCTSGATCVQTAWGSFDVNPTASSTIIPRNYGRGPGQFSVNMRLARTWGFGKTTESAANQAGGPGGPPSFAAGGGPRGGGPRGGGPRGGGPGGMFGDASTGKRYSVTLGLMARNIFNIVNLGNPIGDLASERFGESIALARGMGPSGDSYNRRIDLQLRFSF